MRVNKHLSPAAAFGHQWRPRWSLQLQLQLPGGLSLLQGRVLSRDAALLEAYAALRRHRRAASHFRPAVGGAGWGKPS